MALKSSFCSLPGLHPRNIIDLKMTLGNRTRTISLQLDNKYINHEVILESENLKSENEKKIPCLKRADSGIGKLYYKGNEIIVLPDAQYSIFVLL